MAALAPQNTDRCPPVLDSHFWRSTLDVCAHCRCYLGRPAMVPFRCARRCWLLPLGDPLCLCSTVCLSRPIFKGGAEGARHSELTWAPSALWLPSHSPTHTTSTSLVGDKYTPSLVTSEVEASGRTTEHEEHPHGESHSDRPGSVWAPVRCFSADT
eukprot:scaffold2773_cov410-Prasinococcus_capsulatus_cf.AAC.4